MKKKYYAHRSLGVVKDYFGYIGPKVRISRFRYWVMKILGYRVSTKPYNKNPNTIYEERYVINMG